MAYLRDPTHFIEGRDMLNEAGGKYLERREIMNVFSQHLRKSYPGLDMTTVKREQEKYKAVKMCNFKGCNMAFPDAKALAAHRKTAHTEKKHDHSSKMYTCPCKGCHRKKRSKGFVSMTALREHQIKMEHWGAGMFHGEEGPTPCPIVTEEDAQRQMEEAQAEAGASEAETAALLQAQLSQQDGATQPQPMPTSSPYPPQAIPHHATPQHEADIRMLPMLHQAEAALQQESSAHILHIDPAMQPQTAQPAAAAQVHPAFQPGMQSNQPMNDSMRQDLMDRYLKLQQEMNEVRGALFGA
jgi:hypothetical protein